MLIQAPVRLQPLRQPEANSEWIAAPGQPNPADSVQLSLEQDGEAPGHLGALLANYQPAMINPSADLQENCANILQWLENSRPGDVDTRPGQNAPSVDGVGVVANSQSGSELLAQLMHCAAQTRAAYRGNMPAKVETLLGNTLKAMHNKGIPNPYAARDKIKPLAGATRSPGPLSR